MARDTQHELQPGTDHDGLSRRLAVLASKQALRSTLEATLKEEFMANATDKLTDLTAYAPWASLSRATQNRMWRVLAGQVDAEQQRIDQVAKGIDPSDCGSLTLNPGIEPDYMRGTHIHGQPGGYLLERDPRDIAAGVLYEAGGNLYALGAGIGQKDSKGQRLIQFIQERFPDLEPRTVLEMGCSAGGQSADYAQAFPAARCHAIDLSAAMLRYAHARSSLLDAPVHFCQADAAATPYPDGAFDLIVSHNMFHEVAGSHMPGIIKECHRLLAPGGVVLHQDVPIQIDRLDPWMRALSGWQKDNNDEPFWQDFAEARLPDMFLSAGFSADHLFCEYLQAMDGPIPWYVAGAKKPASV